MTPTDFRKLVRELRQAQRRFVMAYSNYRNCSRKNRAARRQIFEKARDERDRLAAAVDAELGLLVSE